MTLVAALIIGLVGAFGGMVGNIPVYAGGRDRSADQRAICNAANGEHLGQLPQPVSFGASAQTPKGMVMAGGIGSRQVWLLDSQCRLHQLPSLPCQVDSAAACAIGQKVYIAGGNHDGSPSGSLLCLDLDQRQPRWHKVAEIPGLPRLLPVMASDGERLYIWGGFYQGADTTAIHTAGLCFNPADGQWNQVASPPTGISLTAAVAHGCDNGRRIVCCGGYHTRTLLANLRNGRSEKRNRLNGATYIFHPLDGTWSSIPSKQSRARTCAASALLPDGRIMMMGGELAPGVDATIPCVL